AYAADITYGTNNEFGFDYLRDNMVVDLRQVVQRPLHYAIVDEVDNILIDEASTPLIISGQAAEATDRYYQFAQLVRQLRPHQHFEVDIKQRAVTLTEEGIHRVERLLGIPAGESLYDERYFELTHYLENALKAEVIFKRDRDYMVRGGEVIIIDEFTGRAMEGRRYSEGLHQAIEAKEGLKIQAENQTVATITFQNYFRMYRKLAGMTGTAATEEDELIRIYNLDVVVIPTHKPMIRRDYPDAVYRTEKAKFNAVVKEIEECHRRGQPVLVGTTSVEKSELLSGMLKVRGIAHNVLNAKHHEKEAQIVALAGQRGAVTIATNMAGRGTDIVLGEGVADLGGLHVIGTERHEARRIDNQLRGRSGRQGDPGSSRFYLSLEDDLMRLFGADLLAGLLDRLGMGEEDVIEHPLVSRAIEMAQKRVEARHFDARRHVLEYDDVMNRQREVIYRQRRQVLEGENLKPHVLKMVEALVEQAVAAYSHEVVPGGGRDLAGLISHAEQLFLEPGYLKAEDLEGLSPRDLRDTLLEAAKECYERREQSLGPEVMRELERRATLFVVDVAWMDHLAAMDDLKEGIGLRAYGQQDPLLEYRREAFEMFERMVGSIQEGIVRMVYRAQVSARPAPADAASREAQPVAAVARRAAVAGGSAAGAPAPARASGRVGRNDPCPCGSGRKYKKCCGQ
ncbi:MAG: preprotein translocase subunit SecA, partial [Acetobacteraceae bacterium]|nr:preprotein translocase subunit SecA [Acetobacteraceae bacterium]